MRGGDTVAILDFLSSCSDVNYSTEQVQVTAENNDNIVFSGSSNRSPWKVAPLKISGDQFQHGLVEGNVNQIQVQKILELSQNVELQLKQGEEDFKLKLEKAEEDFKLKQRKAEEDFKLKLKQSEEDFKLNLVKAGEDFKLKLRKAEEDFQLKLKQSEEDFKLKQKQVGDQFNVQLRMLSSKVNEHEKKLKLQSQDLDLYSKISTALWNEKSLYKKQLQAAEERHLFKNFVTEENISHYTGLPNLGTFYWLLCMVPAQLNYYFGSAVKCINREDQLFITLFKLRRNVITHQLLADLFKVSLFTISNVVITWISVLHIVLVEFIMNRNVPSLQKVRRSMPEVFNMYPNCRMIFDCTEIEVEVPSLMSNQNQVYSSYKNRTTFKALIVIAPNGTVVYVSDLFPGSTSDKVLVYNCGVLDLLKAGDAVMADKGFPIQDILPPRVDLNLPPFKEIPQFTRGQVFETLQIAKSRIHVERAIQRVKYFHILDKIPHTLFQFATNVFQVCAGLTNLRLSLIKEVEDDMKS
ncbi:Protein ALP1-like [Frankliniella fusca]|uniref:Protein ALP1-like n=1 Tax=Frankliniella fusca TaxID=407009 RepID=A0AAE1HMV0_9NEOP|nr:Protein ALP1-like [Frankliniella fusca]